MQCVDFGSYREQPIVKKKKITRQLQKFEAEQVFDDILKNDNGSMVMFPKKVFPNLEIQTENVYA